MVEPFTSDWKDYFNIAFQKVQAKFSEIYPAAEAGELPPSIIGLKKFVDGLPCPVKILELRVDTERYKYIEDKVCQLIGYDFSKSGDCSVAYYGVIDSHDINGFTKFIAEAVGLRPSESFAESFCRDLSTTYFSVTDKPDIHFHFPRYDIRCSPVRFVDDLLKFMSLVPLSPETAEKFWEKQVDYSVLFGLVADPILPMTKIVEKDSIFGAFVKLSGKETTGITIEDLQQHISDIQLIPQVPEAVKRVFRISKELYIFGYFRYIFFTVSEHYAYLALEAAIKHRYAAALGDKAILTNKKGQSHGIVAPQWESISEFCILHNKEGWNASKTRVNGETFPSTMSSLLKWLAINKIVSKWELPHYEAGVHQRNSLSHLESPSISAPSAQTLRTIAEDINKLFANLVTKSSN